MKYWEAVKQWNSKQEWKNDIYALPRRGGKYTDEVNKLRKEAVRPKLTTPAPKIEAKMEPKSEPKIPPKVETDKTMFDKEAETFAKRLNELPEHNHRDEKIVQSHNKLWSDFNGSSVGKIVKEIEDLYGPLKALGINSVKRLIGKTTESIKAYSKRKDLPENQKREFEDDKELLKRYEKEKDDLLESQKRAREREKQLLEKLGGRVKYEKYENLKRAIQNHNINFKFSI